jgi:hypothetical protein
MIMSANAELENVNRAVSALASTASNVYLFLEKLVTTIS